MILEDNIDRDEQTLTGMLKYGFMLLLISLYNSDNTILKVFCSIHKSIPFSAVYEVLGLLLLLYDKARGEYLTT